MRFYIICGLLLLTFNAFCQVSPCRQSDLLCYKDYLYPSGFPIVIEKKWESESKVSQNVIPLLSLKNEKCKKRLYVTSHNIGQIDIFQSRNGKKIDSLMTKIIGGSTALGYSIMDVNSDGVEEIILAANKTTLNEMEVRSRLICYNIDGTINWISDEDFGVEGGVIGLSNYDQNADIEIYINNNVFNSRSGIKILNRQNYGIGSSNNINPVSFSGNFDNDTSNLEVAAGYTVYKVNIANPDGQAGNTMEPINISYAGLPRDGKTSCADINLDGKLDVVVSHMDGDYIQLYVYSIDDSNMPYLIATTTLPASEKTLGQASIGILDGGNQPSIIVASEMSLRAFSYDGTTLLKEQWHLTTSDRSGQTIATIYDLNNDGINEVIYRDETDLLVIDGSGSTPRIITSHPCKAPTGSEYPVIADIDNTGEAKICITCEIDGVNRLVAFGSPDSLPGWTPARSTWNQYNYHPLAVNEDGTIPQYMPNWATHEGGRYNNFFQQATMLDSNGMYRQPAASLYGDITCVDYDAEIGRYTITFDVINRSDASRTAEGGMPISFFDGDPEAGGMLIDTYPTNVELLPGDTIKGASITFYSSELSELFMVVNTSRASGGTFVEDDYTIVECDYTDNVSQAIDLPKIDSIAASICEGDGYDFYGSTVNNEGLYYHNIKNDRGCDSVVVRLALEVSDTIQINDALTTCESYLWNDSTYTTSGVYTYSTQNALGCDSIVTLDLTIHNDDMETISAIACDSLLWNGMVLTASGSYDYQGQNVFGCDSIVSLDLTIHPSEDTSLTIMACESFTWQDSTYTSSGIYTYSTINQYGCESRTTLDITINDVLQSTATQIACDSFSWNGENYTEDGIYTYNTITSQGCDSIATLDLTINTSALAFTAHTQCDSFLWNGQIYSQSGIYTYQTQTALGCDSTITLDLIIRDRSEVTQDVNTCDTFLWNGQIYTDSGIYTYQTTNQYGCDSVVILDLTIADRTEQMISATVCDSIVWNGEKYTTSGQYSYDTVNEYGCDSTVILDLEVNYSTAVTITESVCDTFIFDGQVLTASGDYFTTIPTAAGCDSVIYLSLAILQSTHVEQVESCDSLQWDVTGATYTASGNYTQTFVNAAGCDSVEILDLMIHDSYAFTDSEEACVTYRWAISGEEFTTSGLYSYPLLTAAGCDSIYLLDLTIYPEFEMADTVTANGAYTWVINGVTYTTAGVYSESYLTDDMCDSIHLLVLEIEKSQDIFVPNVIRPGGDNGKFTIFSQQLVTSILDFSIYDRWGSKVYHAENILPNDPSSGWDGKIDGSLAVPGVYVWKAELLLENGDVLTQVGDVTVVN